MSKLLEKSDFFVLSQKQKDVVNHFKSGRNLFVTGGAGSGKSHLLSFFKKHYGEFGFEVTATTGIAAVNVGGSTIHSWSGIGLANIPPAQIVANLLSPKMSRVRKRIRKAKTLAIDEVSMMSAEVLEILNYVFCAVRDNELPMGGIQILFFGDFLQLPPINRDGKAGFCFNSEIWKSLNLETVLLNDSFRQHDDPQFIKILNNLRFGIIDEDDREQLMLRTTIKDESKIKPTILTTHNAKVEKINEEHLRSIGGEEVIYEAKYFGSPDRIEFLKKNCMASKALKLKVGAQVMMIKNTYQKDGIINGSLGIIKDFSSKKSFPIVEFENGVVLTISQEEWLIEKYDEEKQEMIIEAGANQIPLILAWAITIHKSQGLTLDKISCDLQNAFSHGQVYVALSRARSLSGVFIESINFNSITSDQEAVRFYRSIS